MAFRGPNLVRTRITVDGSSVDALHFQPFLSVCTIILYTNTNDTTQTWFGGLQSCKLT